MRRAIKVFFLLFSSISLSLGQHAVDPTQGMHRVICLVHMIGSGTMEDPMRPEYVPGPGESMSREGIIAWSFQPTDDGKMAIVHLVAAKREALERVWGDKRPEVRIFEIGKHGRAEIELELRKFKKDFNLDTLKVLAR